jgi:membrane fusion protein, heavy metal efflux system
MKDPRSYVAEPAGSQEDLTGPHLRQVPRRLTLTVLAAVLAGAAVVVGVFLLHRPRPPAKDVAGIVVGSDSLSLAPTAPQWKQLQLGAVAKASTRWTDPLPARVTIDETRVSNVGAPLSGRVSGVFIELGQRVKTGTALFSIASADIATLGAERAKADIDLAAARNNLERVRAMVAAHSMPAKDLVIAEQRYRQAELLHKLAYSKLNSLHVSSRGDNEFVVAAKRDGVVVEKNLVAGQAVAPDSGKPLVMIADLSWVWVLADLPEVDALQIKERARALITSPSLPALTIEGTVDMVSSVVDPDRHTIPIRVRLPNKNGLLKPNMFAQVKFSTGAKEDLSEIPAEAVVNDGEHQYVFVQGKPGQFSRRKVLVGAVRDGKVLVLSGLRLNETVVVGGAILLENYMTLPRESR